MPLLPLLALQDVVRQTQQHGGLSAGTPGGNAKLEARRPIFTFRCSPTQSTRWP